MNPRGKLVKSERFCPTAAGYPRRNWRAPVLPPRFIPGEIEELLSSLRGSSPEKLKSSCPPSAVHPRRNWRAPVLPPRFIPGELEGFCPSLRGHPGEIGGVLSSGRRSSRRNWRGSVLRSAVIPEKLKGFCPPVGGHPREKFFCPPLLRSSQGERFRLPLRDHPGEEFFCPPLRGHPWSGTSASAGATVGGGPANHPLTWGTPKHSLLPST
jgi:hypothetical protein